MPYRVPRSSIPMVSEWADPCGLCPLCLGDPHLYRLGSQLWCGCPECRTCWKLGENLATPPHVIRDSPRRTEFGTWEAFYLNMLMTLSLFDEVEPTWDVGPPYAEIHGADETPPQPPDLRLGFSLPYWR